MWWFCSCFHLFLLHLLLFLLLFLLLSHLMLLWWYVLFSSCSVFSPVTQPYLSHEHLMSWPCCCLSFSTYQFSRHCAFGVCYKFQEIFDYKAQFYVSLQACQLTNMIMTCKNRVLVMGAVWLLIFYPWEAFLSLLWQPVCLCCQLVLYYVCHSLASMLAPCYTSCEGRFLLACGISFISFMGLLP